MKKFMYYNIIILIIYILYNHPEANTTNDKFILVDFLSRGMAIREYSGTLIIGGEIKTEYNKIIKRMEPVLYTKRECINAIKKYYFEYVTPITHYIGNGVYEWNAKYARYVCLEYDSVKKYRNTEFNDMIYLTNIDNTKNTDIKIDSHFTENFPNAIPKEIIMSEIPNYTIFPLDEDQAEARTLTDELNKEIEEELNKQKIEKLFTDK